MTPNLLHLSTKMLGHLDSNAPYLMPLSPISMIYLTSTQQPAPRHFHTAPWLTSLPLKSFNSPHSQNIKWRTTGSKMPSHLSNFHQKTWLSSFPLNSLTHRPSKWHPIPVIFAKKPWPISLNWLTSLPLASLPSNYLNHPRVRGPRHGHCEVHPKLSWTAHRPKIVEETQVLADTEGPVP